MEVEIVSGLEEGEDVLLRRPTAGEIVSEIDTDVGRGDVRRRPSRVACRAWKARGPPGGKPAGVAATGKPASAGTS